MRYHASGYFGNLTNFKYFGHARHAVIKKSTIFFPLELDKQSSWEKPI